MFNLFDLMVIIFMVLSALSLLSLCLMFLSRNIHIKKICFFIVAALGVYAGSIGIRSGTSLFPVQTAFGTIAAVMLVVTTKGNGKKFKLAQLIASAALVVGITNAFM